MRTTISTQYIGACHKCLKKTFPPNSRLFRNEGISLNTEWNALNKDTLLLEEEIVNSVLNCNNV